MKKKRVDIFIGPIACTCAGGPSPAKQEKITKAFTLKNALKKEPVRFEVFTWNLGEDDKYGEGFELLRKYLLDSGKRELSENLAFSINNATPSVAVDGDIVNSNDIPTYNEFINALDMTI